MRPSSYTAKSGIVAVAIVAGGLRGIVDRSLDTVENRFNLTWHASCRPVLLVQFTPRARESALIRKQQ